MLHYSKIVELMNKQDAKGKPVQFSFEFVKKSTGERIRCNAGQLTSSHFRPWTVNIKWVDSEQIRKIKIISIVQFNDVEVYL